MFRTALLTIGSAVGIAGVALLAHDAQAGQYQVTASRKSSNFYKVDGQPFYFETRMCLELALRTPILLDTSSGVVTFQNNYGTPSTCALRGVYEEQSFRGKALDGYGNVVDVQSLLVPAKL